MDALFGSLVSRLRSLVCLLMQLVRLALVLSGKGGGLSFFIHFDGFPLTRYQFCSVLKKCLSVIGLAGYRFTSHSFRIGAVTEADRLGLGKTIIRKIDRWGLDRFCLYVRPDLILC